ncbi:MAG: tRNA uridine-5-carboxymethylaminomethyl(34) synthesis enzyme MnmG [Candidatus Dadabacteria bacterium]|nr:tRNA uridine-5-carboxymethylaminomethyl(34) synthesis enzyme MnmG [Candidatus Dadabacteria bacterium]MDE0477308.1 tRNA uridine-5-carboxymethylaminomethyl(34) synthesis enzyme MnmG [Candidatus Dadabacteria bacterium]
MSLLNSKKYEVIVIGGGHAGCEAALAAARMGCTTLVLTANIDTIGLMSCNPSIGGVGKGHLVKEIDALGGEMGKAADTAAIQFRRLNTRKGAAVQATRIQADRQSYRAYMKKALESEANIEIKQAMVEEFLVDGKKVAGVKTALGERFFSDTVVVTPGTFPGGLIHIGLTRISSGRAGEAAAGAISNSFADLGFTTGRLKTGTPPRFDGRTIEWDKLERQDGDQNPVPFSFSPGEITTEQMPCYITYTNEETHRVINENIDKSPLYSGLIKGIGPRYCPSIEDKVVKFPDRNRHQIFLEPEGRNTYEIYPNGISTSLPIEVQHEFSRTMEGLRNVEIMRPGYAVEYDFLDPTQLGATLESKLLENIFFAGQVNGTTGYEEAASQGLIAGINAALRIKGKDPFVLRRSEAYIGILIDDLVTKGVDEPYRMFTSRAEYRLILREDNADLRLGELGHTIGLLSDERVEEFRAKKTALENELARLESEKVVPNEKTNRILENLGSQRIKKPQSLKEILRRPRFTYEMLGFIDSSANPDISPKLGAQIEMEVKYEGYIKRQREEVGKLQKFENMKIPETFEYKNIPGLSNEIVQKLSRVKPESVGQASRVSGITPAAISVLLVHIRKTRGIEQEAQLKSSSPS